MTGAAQPSPDRPVDVLTQAARRRTFAVISHPDAGKSTLTEALALHVHAISEAGATHGKAGRRSTVSDWMEQARGISISSTSMQFELADVVFNLVDIEQRIALRPTPVTWPVGVAGDFHGVVDARDGSAIEYVRTAGAATIAPQVLHAPDEAARRFGDLRDHPTLELEPLAADAV